MKRMARLWSLAGWSVSPPPGIEQVFWADPDVDEDGGAHRLARLRSKPSQAEQIAPEKVRRTNANSDVGVLLVAMVW